ncbi:MAG: putative membrane protein YedE/YeeE [Moritella sp.]|jgi:uncharacterized membrane protein YedE/YeeE
MVSIMLFELPWSSIAGGLLLGLSASLLLLMNGRIAGISGILAGLVHPINSKASWQFVFVIGMLLGGLIAPSFGYALPTYDSYATSSSLGWIVAAGLLVGFGTKLGNGCTSGHGICGIGRLSKRSMVATCVFMASAMLTVFIRLHL